MKKLNKDQKRLLGEFYTNLAVALLAVGVIAPVFSPVKDMVVFTYSMALSGGVSFLLIRTSVQLLKK